MNGLKEMAEQAGMHYRRIEDEFCKANTDGVPMEMLEAFAKLVADKEREKLKNVAIFDRWYQELDAAVLAEREACAKVCEDSVEYAGDTLAEAIRARV